MRLSWALEEQHGDVSCRDCGAFLVETTAISQLKQELDVNRHPVSADLIGGDTDQFVDRQPEIAEYSCPNCGLLIDTEVTVSTDPIRGRDR